MAYLFPRFALTPARCAPIRHEFAPLFSLFDDAARQLDQVARQPRRRPFNPRFDVKEDQTSYILEGEVPGFQDGDLSVEWNDNVLAIRGRHETVTESGKKPEAIQEPAVEASIEAAAVSETSSVKSHQATVEDEQPAADTTSSTTENKEASNVAAEAPAKTEVTKPEVQHWISERSTGEFLRQFSFPSNAVNHEAIKASLQSGILKIVVPKAEVQASRRINIE